MTAIGGRPKPALFRGGWGGHAKKWPNPISQ